MLHKLTGEWVNKLHRTKPLFDKTLVTLRSKNRLKNYYKYDVLKYTEIKLHHSNASKNIQRIETHSESGVLALSSLIEHTRGGFEYVRAYHHECK